MIAQTMSSFMFAAIGVLILPAAFDADQPDNAGTEAGVLTLSHGTALILLIIYILFLFYQLKTHSRVFQTEDLDGNDEEDTTTVVTPSWATVPTILIVSVAVSICSNYLVG